MGIGRALVLATATAVAVFLVLQKAHVETRLLSLQPPALSKYEKHFIALDREAITQAYRDQIHHLFLTWAKDPRDQPTRAVTGAKQARDMYERSMTAIDERERRLKAGEP